MRTEVVLAIDGDAALISHDSDDEDVVRNLAGPSKDAQEKFTRHGELKSGGDELTAELDANTDERQKAVTQDQHLRLMLRLVAFEQTEEENVADRTWFLPVTVMPDSIKASIGALNQYLLSPPSLDKDPKTLVRAVRRRRAKSPEYNSDGEVIAPVRKRRQPRTEELQVYKSAAYIDDSDDDEGDAAFFAREAMLRAEMSAMAEASGSAMRRTGTKKRKRKNNGIEPMPLADMDVNAMDEGSDGDDESGKDGAGDSDDEPRVRSRSVVPSDSDDEVMAKRPRATLSPASVISDAPVTQGRRRAVIDSDDE